MPNYDINFLLREMCLFQSGFRAEHSVTTALFKATGVQRRGVALIEVMDLFWRF